MKRIIIIAAALLLGSASIFAQHKNQKYLSIESIDLCKEATGFPGLKAADKKPDELESIIALESLMGFKIDKVVTCRYIKGKYKEGDKWPASSVQSALYTKGKSEYIVVNLNIAQSNKTMGSKIEMMMKNPMFGGNTQIVDINGYTGLMLNRADEDWIEIRINDYTFLNIHMRNIKGTRDFSINPVEFARQAFSLNRFQLPKWFTEWL